MEVRPAARPRNLSRPVIEKQSCWTLMLAVVLVGSVGCGEAGSPRAAVQGNVTWEGKPIENGTINFVSTGSGGAATAKIVDGKYQLEQAEGAPLGTNRVEIFGFTNLGSREAGPPHPPGTMVEVTEQFIPNEYNNASRQTVEIQTGDNTYDLNLPIK